MKLILSIIAFPLGSSAFGQVLLTEDFNRADGAVGNGWTSWWGNQLPGDGETRIENGALRAPGFFHQEGGIFRDNLSLPSEFYFQFDFRTDTPNDGGFDIRLGGIREVPNTPADLNSYQASFRFMMFAGDRSIRRVTTRNGVNVIEDLPVLSGQRRFGSTWRP